MDVIEAAGGIFYEPYKVYKSGRKTTSPSLEPDSGFSRDGIQNMADNGKESSTGSVLPNPSEKNTAGAMAMASAKSLGKLSGKGIKGLAVDVPLAAAEGFRNVPTMYGEQVRNHGNVTDWKSGAIVGGKVSAPPKFVSCKV